VCACLQKNEKVIFFQKEYRKGIFLIIVVAAVVAVCWSASGGLVIGQACQETHQGHVVWLLTLDLVLIERKLGQTRKLQETCFAPRRAGVVENVFRLLFGKLVWQENEHLCVWMRTSGQEIYNAAGNVQHLPCTLLPGPIGILGKMSTAHLVHSLNVEKVNRKCFRVEKFLFFIFLWVLRDQKFKKMIRTTNYYLRPRDKALA